MAEVYKTITTDEELRVEIGQNGYVPTDIVYIKTTKAKSESKPLKVDNKEKTFKEQFRVDERGDDAYIPVGRTHQVKGKKTGNFQKLSKDEFAPWVEEFGPDAFCLKPPEIEVI